MTLEIYAHYYCCLEPGLSYILIWFFQPLSFFITVGNNRGFSNCLQFFASLVDGTWKNSASHSFIELFEDESDVTWAILCVKKPIIQL